MGWNVHCSWSYCLTLQIYYSLYLIMCVLCFTVLGYIGASVCAWSMDGVVKILVILINLFILIISIDVLYTYALLEFPVFKTWTGKLLIFNDITLLWANSCKQVTVFTTHMYTDCSHCTGAIWVCSAHSLKLRTLLVLYSYCWMCCSSQLRCRARVGPLQCPLSEDNVWNTSSLRCYSLPDSVW